MNKLKRMTIGLLALLPLASPVAFANPDHGYSRLFVFGDSLSDPGNRFAVTGETAHPPFVPVPDAAYGIGGHHFSNGRTWVEVLAQKMKLTKWAKPAWGDRSFGNYAYAGARGRDHSPTAPSFGDQVQAWIGAGHCSGVANAPNLGVAPLVEPAYKEGVTQLSRVFNQLLQFALATYFSDLNISTVNLFGFVNGASMMPETLGFSNGTESCLTFGVVEDAFCTDRDGYLFWDAVHPTRKAHALIGEIALGQLP